jgi:hypothetical protein
MLQLRACGTAGRSRIAVARLRSAAAAHAREMLAIGAASPCSLQTGEEIAQRLTFTIRANADRGMIGMSLKGADGVEVVAIFNATQRDLTFKLDSGAFKLSLDPARLRPTTVRDDLCSW